MDNLIADPRVIASEYQLGHIVNHESICPRCRVRLKKNDSETCLFCSASVPRRNEKFMLGRKPKFTDEQVLDFIERGAHTANRLLPLMGLTHKSTLMIRLRRMRDEGQVTLVERKRSEGFSVYSNRKG